MFTILSAIALNVLAVTDDFLRPMRKMRSILRAQKTVAKQNTAKGVSPTGGLCSLAAESGVLLQSCYVPLGLLYFLI
jgi:hypothetical protein